MIVRRCTVSEAVRAWKTVSLRVSCACVVALLCLMEGRTGPLYWSWAAYLCLCLAVRATIDQINLFIVLIDHLVISMHSLTARVVAAYHNNRDLSWEHAERFMSLIHYVFVCSTGDSLISLTAQQCFYTLVNPSKSSFYSARWVFPLGQTMWSELI